MKRQALRRASQAVKIWTRAVKIWTRAVQKMKALKTLMPEPSV